MSRFLRIDTTFIYKFENSSESTKILIMASLIFSQYETNLLKILSFISNSFLDLPLILIVYFV